MLRMLPWGAALAGCAAVVTCYAPGQMNSDSLDQFGQARAGVYNDWHPPIMSWLWHQTDAVIPGPLGMLLLQNLAFWFGLALILQAHLPPVRAAIWTLLIGLIPSCFPMLGTVWKDTGMGSALLLALALIDRFGRSRSRLTLAAAVVFLLYAFAVRKNAAAAGLPIACFGGFLCAKTGGARQRRLWLGAASGLVGGVFLFASAQGLNRWLAGPRITYQAQQLCLHDLVGISLARGENLLPAYLQNNPTSPILTQFPEIYTPITVNALIFGNGPHIPLTSDRKDYDRLLHQWKTQMALHPRAYFAHRNAVFINLLGLGPKVTYPYHWGINRNEWGFATPHSAFFNRTMRIVEWLKDSWFFRCWFFVLLGVLAGLCALLRKKVRLLTLTLVASIFTYLVLYYIVAPAGDFRLVWWAVVAALVALPISLADANHPTEDQLYSKFPTLAS